MAAIAIPPAELAAVFRDMADGISVQRSDGTLLYANDAAARLLSVESGEELVGLPGTALLERVELIDEHGGPFPADQLPNRLALATGLIHEGVVGYRLRATTDERWSFVRSTPIRAAGGAVEMVVNVFHDVTRERQADERLHLLAEAGVVLSSSLDYEETLAELARLLVPRLADYVLVDAIEEGALRQVVISHRDAAREEVLREVRRRYPPEENASHPVSRVLAGGEPFLVENAREEELARSSVDEDHLRLYRELEATSYIVAPLEARGRLLGTISLGTGESRRRFGPLDLELAREIARRAGLAMDNALLYRAAQQSYAQLETLLASAPVAIGFWDRDLRFLRLNEALAQLNGMPQEEHLGRTLAEVIPGLAAALEPLYQRVLETGEPVVHEESTDEAAKGPGQARHWLSSYYPVFGDAGTPVGVGGMILETTGQRRADARLRLLAEAGELFSSSLDREEILERIARVVVPRIADACNIYLADGDVLTRVAYANADPEREHLMARLPDGYVIGPDAPPVFRQILTTGEPLLAPVLGPELVEALGRIGVDRDVFAEVGSASMMFVPFVSRGQTLGLLTLGSREPGRFGESDLELALELARRASGALENARLVIELTRRAQAAQALEFVGDGVFLVGEGGIVRLWNPAASRITGLREEDVVGAAAADVLGGWPLAGPGARAATFPIDRHGREVWLSLTATAFPEGTVYAFRDLTEERVVERLKTDFVSTVSHELRTPLAAIYGAAMTLRRQDVVLGQSDHDGMLEVISGESERLARIVNDILLASRLDSGAATVAIEPTNAGAIARAVVAAAETHLPAGIELALVAPEPEPLVAADADGLRQVLVNLVENAVKYSPDGGLVELVLEPVGERARFAVRDRGLGIPASEQERIFEKFFRLDPNLSRGVGGTGLGLYISREIVRRMGGRLRVESEPGHGSTFSFELPLA